MSIPVLIIGKSGTGKSTSLRNLDPAKVSLINVIGKPLPFKGGNKFKSYVCDDPTKIESAIALAKTDIVVIDDGGYILTNMFMRTHASAGTGNGVFQVYNALGDSFWHLIEEAKSGKENRRIYFIMHEEQNDFGQTKPKTIGKLLDEKVCIEGMFTIVLRSMFKDGKYLFRTQTDGSDVSKSPIGMFENTEIDNDLAAVDKAICDYYEINEGDKNND